METILVTGGAGFIGSHLCECLLRKGKKVICVDNFNDFYSPKVKDDNHKSCRSDPSFVLCRSDIRDFNELELIFSKNKIDKICHLAATVSVRPSPKSQGLYTSVNVKGTENLLEFSEKYKVKRLVFASSSSVYGDRKDIPFIESDRPARIISEYAVTKKAGEELCLNFHDKTKIPVTCLRLFTVYGPRGRPDMAVHKFTKLIEEGTDVQVYGDGTISRDYTHVSDVVDAFMSALSVSSGYEIINIGNSKPVKLNELIDILESILGKKAKIKRLDKPKEDVNITFADINKAKKLLGYTPKVDIKEGVRIFVEWFKKNKSISNSK